jgi:hypothetical protein
LPEDVRMPISHLSRDLLQDLYQVKLPPLLSQADKKKDLEEEITQLLTHILGSPSLDGIKNLIRLLQQIHPDGGICLKDIPWTAISAAEFGYQVM